MTTTVFSGVEKDADITLSSDQLTAYVAEGSEIGWKNIRTDAIDTTYPVYMEFTILEGQASEILLGVGPGDAGIDSDFGNIYRYCQFSTAPAANAAIVYVTDASQWPEVGWMMVIDSTNDQDFYSWNQRLNNSLKSTTVTNGDVKAILAHTINSRLYPLDVDSVTNKINSFKATYNAYSSAGGLYYPIDYPGTDPTKDPWDVSLVMEAAWADSYKKDDVIGLAIDPLRGVGWFSKNNVWQRSGLPVYGTNVAFQGLDISNGFSIHTTMKIPGNRIKANFGASPFVYSPPSGFVGLDSIQTNYHIEGVVAKLGAAVARNVVLLDREWKIVIQTLASDPSTGVYRFNNVRGDRVYTVLALPNTGETNINALVLDHITPTPN